MHSYGHGLGHTLSMPSGTGFVSWDRGFARLWAWTFAGKVRHGKGSTGTLACPCPRLSQQACTSCVAVSGLAGYVV